MSEKSRRRWFRFSLRTLLVAMTVLCCWLGWEMSIVRQRRAELTKLRTTPSVEITTAADWPARFPKGATVPPAANIPLVRQWLGDEAIQEIGFVRYYHNFSEQELARLAEVFPEAQVQEKHVPLEPCHPGCFPRGTLAETPQGARRIESIAAGDLLTAYLPGSASLPNRESVSIPVHSVFVTENRLWKIETEAGVLLTTEQQPLCLAANRVLPAGKLQPGDEILRCQQGRIQSTKVLRVSPTERIEKVFNLVLRDSELFVAGGFLARSKPPAEVAAR